MTTLGELPGAILPCRRRPLPLILLFYALVYGGTDAAQRMLGKPLSRRRLLLAPLLLGPAAWWALSRRPDPDAGKLRVIAVDVGQGDCTLVITPGGRTLLMDGGGTSDETAAGDTDVGAKIVVPFLQYLGINKIDVLVATHPHGDHVGGLAAVLRGPQIGLVLDGTTLPYPSPAYLEFRQLVGRSKIPCARAVRGQALDMGDGVRVLVLNPPPDNVLTARRRFTAPAATMRPSTITRLPCRLTTV